MIYDAMDNFPEFHNGIDRERIRAIESSIASRSDAVICTPEFLADKFAALSNEVRLVPNGFDSALVSKVLNNNEHESEKSDVVGYLGTVSSWFDQELFSDVAIRNQNIEFEIVGPIYLSSRATRSLPSNVKFIGTLTQELALEHALKFSSAIIPFKKNPLTDGVDPVKFYEYAALGIPVYSTQFGSMSQRIKDGEAFPLSDNVNFSEHLSSQSKTKRVGKISLTGCDWGSRFEAVRDLFSS
jgi:glycosyltransferase involved in cell wall biosynthesis